jgi:hypothetical protein
MSSCRQARRWMERAFDGRLGVDEDFLLEEHLGGCAHCRREAELQAMVLDGLVRQVEPPVERLDIERALSNIHERLEEEPARVLPWRKITAAAAAALLLTLPWWMRGEDAPAVEEPGPGIGGALALDEPEQGRSPEAEQPSLTAVRVYPRVSAESEVDSSVHARVQAEVRAALAVAVVSHPADVDAILQAFDASTSELAAADWPVARLVARLVEDESPALAGAACRFTGRHATRLGVRRLEQALDSPAAFDAAKGLIDAGPLGYDGLARALWVPGADAQVLEAMLPLDDEARVRWATDALEHAPEVPEEGTTAAWVGFVAAAGRAGADELIGRLDDPVLARGDVIAGLMDSPRGEDALLARLERRVAPQECDGLFDLIDQMRAPAAFEFIQEQAWSGQDRGRAALVLAGYPGVSTLVGLLMLDEGRRLDTVELGAAWRRALEVDAERAQTLALEHVDRGDRIGSRRLLEGLTLAEHAGAVPAMIELAALGALADDDREHAFLIIAERGGAQDVPLLSDTFSRFTVRDRDRAAACLISLHRLGGAEAVQRVLAGASEDTSARVLSRLEDGARASSRLLLARELEPVLASHEALTWRTLR